MMTSDSDDEADHGRNPNSNNYRNRTDEHERQHLSATRNQNSVNQSNSSNNVSVPVIEGLVNNAENDFDIQNENIPNGYDSEDPEEEPITGGYLYPSRRRLILVDSSDDSDAIEPRLNHSMSSFDMDHLSGRDDSQDEESENNDDSFFDKELPLRHTYLGHDMEELQGRTLLEEDSVIEIPLIVMNVHLVPGQTLPMTVFHAAFQNAIRRCIQTDRLLGIVNNEFESYMLSRPAVNRGDLGTLAEIYEFQKEDSRYGGMRDEDGLSLASSFTVKAKGRQRFNVVDIRRQADGNLMGRVRIRPEVRLPFPLSSFMSDGSGRFAIPYFDCPYEEDSQEMTEDPVEPSEPCSSSALTCQSSKELTATEVSGDIMMQNKINSRHRAARHFSALTPWPYFVYDQYEENVLVRKVHDTLNKELVGLAETTNMKIPYDATQLSYWFAQNITIEDSIRSKILRMDGPVERLKYELNLLNMAYKTIICKKCEAVIGDASDILAMSIEGPQGTYVNPQGCIHEILTVNEAKQIVYRGAPSIQASWFPGYSWLTAECRTCRQHIGWKFKAVEKLKPTKFWGLTRRSVGFKYDFPKDVNDEVKASSNNVSSTSTIGGADSSS